MTATPQTYGPAPTVFARMFENLPVFADAFAAKREADEAVAGQAPRVPGRER